MRDVVPARGRKIVRQAVTSISSSRRAVAAVGIGILIVLTAVGVSSWWQARGGSGSGRVSSIEAGRTSSPEAYDLVLQARMRTSASSVPMAETAANAHAAIELLNRAIELDRSYAGAYATLGEAYSILVVAENRSWADSALAAARKAIELEPDLAEGHEALGYTWDAIGRRTEALTEYRRAIDLDPNSIDARDEAAERLYMQGRFDEALETLLPAVRRDPNDVDRYVRIAALYGGLGLYDLAERWAEAVQIREPDNGLVHATRSYWEMEQGDLERADAEVKQALTFAPGTQTALDAAAALALARGRYDEAREHIEELSRGRSIEYAYLVTPAYLEWKTGSRATAESLLGEAERRSLAMIAEAPEDVEGYMDMTRIESIRGNPDEAMSWMEKAYERGARFGAYYRFDPRLEDLRGDPRFQHMTERMDEDVAAMRARAPEEEP